MPKDQSDIIPKLKEKQQALKEEAQKTKENARKCYLSLQSKLPAEIQKQNPKINVPYAYGYKLAVIHTKLIGLQSMKNKIRKAAKLKKYVPFGQWLGPLSCEQGPNYQERTPIKRDDETLSDKGSYSISTRCESLVLNS